MLHAVVLTSLSCPYPGLCFDNLNGDRRMQICSLGQVGNLHSINVARITAFLSHQRCLFPTVVTQVQFAHLAGFCFPDKSTGELMTDQDTMVVTLCCPPKLPARDRFIGDGPNGLHHKSS